MGKKKNQVRDIRAECLMGLQAVSPHRQSGNTDEEDVQEVRASTPCAKTLAHLKSNVENKSHPTSGVTREGAIRATPQGRPRGSVEARAAKVLSGVNTVGDPRTSQQVRAREPAHSGVQKRDGKTLTTGKLVGTGLLSSEELGDEEASTAGEESDEGSDGSTESDDSDEGESSQKVFDIHQSDEGSYGSTESDDSVEGESAKKVFDIDKSDEGSDGFTESDDSEEGESAHKVFDKMPTPACAAIEDEPTSDKSVEGQTKPSYASLFRNNRELTQGLQLEYMQVEEVVTIENEDVIDIEQSWGYCLVGCFTGRLPWMKVIEGLTMKWQVQCRILPHHQGWLIFQFNSEEDRTSVLTGGPYVVFGRTLLMKKLSPGFAFDYKDFMQVPIWVQLSNVPLELWNARGLSKLGSRIGKPMCTDKITSNKSQIGYARILVEVDVSTMPVTNFEVKMPGGSRYTQSVHYETFPSYCCHCKILGRNPFECKKKTKKQQLRDTLQVEAEVDGKQNQPIQEMEGGLPAISEAHEGADHVHNKAGDQQQQKATCTEERGIRAEITEGRPQQESGQQARTKGRKELPMTSAGENETRESTSMQIRRSASGNAGHQKNSNTSKIMRTSNRGMTQGDTMSANVGANSDGQEKGITAGSKRIVGKRPFQAKK